MKPIDVAVGGCGIAGLATALLLARDGHRVTLFDRFAEPRPIGSGLLLQPTGLAVLARLGLADAAIAGGSRVERLIGIAANSGRPVLDVRYPALRADTYGVGIHRATLFDLLHDAVARSGVRILSGHVITGSRPVRDRRELMFADGVSADADLVVDALGARSPLVPAGRALAYGALWANVPWPGAPFDPHALQQRYRRASVMAGVLPVGRRAEAGGPCAAFFWSLRTDRYSAWQQAGLEAWKAEVITLWPQTEPLLAAIRHADDLTLARYAHRTLARPAEPALIHIGDAWHSTSPQLGQGANTALLDAWALAMALRDAESLPAGLAAAVRLRRRHVRLYQAMSRLFTPVYQSDGRVLPFLRDRLVGPVSMLGPLNRLQAAMVSGIVGGPLKPLGLA